MSGHRLTLVSAPAGYGKSTLVSQWMARVKLPIAWLSLDEMDDEPTRFLLYFLAALQKMEPAFADELFAALNAGQLPPLDVLITTIANGMMGWQNMHILVIDDFQCIQNKTILDVLTGLLAHQPHSFKLILVTREDPALPLARFRASGQLTEIRADDLRFSNEESFEFLCAGMGLALSTQDIARLTERTEGWAVGLQLAGLSLQGRENLTTLVDSLNGSHRFILDYLIEEVLKRQPAHTQDFLMQTSILTSLSGDLCDEITGRKDSVMQLEALLDANLFLIPLDDAGHWYRYHHLFAELLQTQLHRIYPERVGELHQRASRWYEAHSMPFEAIEHAVASGDGAVVVQLIETYGWKLLNQGYTRKIEDWMQHLPPHLRASNPRICLDFAWTYLLRSHFNKSQSYLQQAQAALDQRQQNPATQALLAESLTLLANLHQVQGNIPASVKAAQDALSLIDPENAHLAGLAWLALGGAYRQTEDVNLAIEALNQSVHFCQESQDWVTWMLAISHLTLMSIQHGRLRFAAEVGSKAIEQIKRQEITPPPIVGVVYGSLGLIAFEQNQLGLAKEYLAKGIRLGMVTGHNASLIFTKGYLTRMQQAEGDLEAATHTLDEIADLIRAGAPGWIRPEYIYRQTCLLLALGKLAEVESVLNQSGVAPTDEINRRADWIHLAWLRLLIAKKDPSVKMLTGRILHFSEADQRYGTSLQALILGALACNNKDWLERALELASSEGYVRIFLDEGAPMLAMLQTIPNSAYARKLIGDFSASMVPKTIPNLPADLFEPLTERELEVLHLLADGLTYAEIANRLVVSINTVRYHIKLIYGKLAVEKQVQAVERGRELGLI